MSDNISIKDGSGATVLAATMQLSDTAQAPKVAIMGGTTPGSEVTVGPKAKAAALPFTIATDDPLLAGTRRFIQKTGLANGSGAYAANQSLLTNTIAIATGLASGTIVTRVRITLKVTKANLTTSGALNIFLFDANPTSSTFTAGVGVTIANADLPSLIAGAAAVAVVDTGTGAAEFWISTFDVSAAVDSAGHLYFAMTAAAALQFASTSVLLAEIEVSY